MFKLVKVLVSLALLGLFVVFGLTVKLGERTLFGHVRAIAGAKETKDLVDGTEQAARPIIDRVRGKPPPATAAPAASPGADAAGPSARAASPPPDGVPAAHAPADKISDGDRGKLRRVLGGAPARGPAEPARAHPGRTPRP